MIVDTDIQIADGERYVVEEDHCGRLGYNLVTKNANAPVSRVSPCECFPYLKSVGFTSSAVSPAFYASYCTDASALNDEAVRS